MVVVCLRVVGVVLVVAEVEQGGNLGRLRHSRGFDQHVVEQLLLSEGNDLVDKVALESAAEAAVLHRNHLVALHESRLVNQTLVNVEGGHVVDNDSTPEVLLLMLRLQNVLHQSCLAGPQEATEQGHRQEVFLRDRHLNKMLIQSSSGHITFSPSHSCQSPSQSCCIVSGKVPKLDQTGLTAIPNGPSGLTAVPRGKTGQWRPL